MKKFKRRTQNISTPPKKTVLKINDSLLYSACLVAVRNLGVLIIGKSGVGKSDVVLRLLNAGHDFVADDVVCLSKSRQQIFGAAHPKTHGQLHIRGIGILMVSEIFGSKSCVKNTAVDVVIEFCSETEFQHYPTVDTEELFCNVKGVLLPFFRLPAVCHRDGLVLIETICQKISVL